MAPRRKPAARPEGRAIGPRASRRPRTAKSLRSSAGFEAFVLDQLSELGEVTSRRMFGGVGLYCGGDFFGIISRDELYLRVDDETRGVFEAAGSQPFKPYPDRPVTMQYYAVPVDVLESAPALLAWARRAVKVARRMAP